HTPPWQLALGPEGQLITIRRQEILQFTVQSARKDWNGLWIELRRSELRSQRIKIRIVMRENDFQGNPSAAI
ncbi:MAG: hypothetical protein JSW37_01220, partial [Anaerolineales bacterium]